MCGKLATYLRMCGHDTASALDRGVECDDELAGLAREENRTLLTRDTALACRVEEAILLEATPGPPGSLARARDRIMPVVALPAAVPFLAQRPSSKVPSQQNVLPTERSP
jgi:hypothetical protein